MTLNRSAKLGAAFVLAFAVAAPLLAAAPASAEPMRIVETDHARGPIQMVRYEHRSERGHRDMYWREARFHRHDMGWLHGHQRDAHFGR